MVNFNKAKSARLLLALVLTVTSLVAAAPAVALAAEPTVTLGTASGFGVLAGSTITNTGTTTIGGTAGGSIGLHPGDGTILGTFPGQAGVTLLNGTVHLYDGVAEQAKVDLLAAYTSAAGRTSNYTIAADLGGTTLTPGVYTSASSIGISGILTLDAGGDANAVFIFQAGSTLTTATNSEIRLINGAQACHIFWQIGSSATLGTDSHFAGHILAMESITATTGAEINGQLLAIAGAVTLDNNVITNDLCSLSAGSLRVTKEVQGPVTGLTLPEFVVTVTGPGEFSDTQTIASGASYTWENLVSGVYTVSEGTLSTEWNAVGTGEHDVQFGEVTDVTLVNTYTAVVAPVYGRLTVAKVVAENTGDMSLPPFVITVTGPAGFTATRTLANGELYTWENLVPGAYTVTESRTGLSSEWTVTGEGAVQVVANQTAIATITNSYIAVVAEPYGTLTLSKTVAGNIGDMTLPLFVLTVNGPNGFTATRSFVHGQSYTWTNLVPGTYTVTESRTGLSSEWTVTGEGAVQVVANQTAIATITNSYIAVVTQPYGTLTLSKAVAGNIGNMTLPIFVLTVNGPDGFTTSRTFVHGQSYTWENLVPGAYTVTESRLGLSNEWTVTGEGTVQVVGNQTALWTVTNTYEAEIVLDVDTDLELPDTGVDAPFMTYLGLTLLGLGLVVWRKQS
jgi:LPXTG-motif cell wall-anchored protein